MTKPELLKILIGFHGSDDSESNHYQADQALLEYIGDDEIKDAYENITRWYS